MKKLMLTVCLVLGLLVAPMAMADQVKSVGGAGGYGLYQTGQGGEFTLLTDAGLNWVLNMGYVDAVTKNIVQTGTFQTFCVEHAEYIYAGQWNDVTISDHSVNTGVILTKGAAYLYHQFQLGTLQGYDWTRTATPINETQQLQDAIWFYMGVGNDLSNQFTTLAESILGSETVALQPNSGMYPVAVLNLWVPNSDHSNKDNARQDMLVCVPEPGILILLGIAMSAIGAASWRLRKLKI